VATAAAFAANGAAVAVVGRDKPSLAAVVRSIEADGGRAAWVAADCTDANDAKSMANLIADRLGPVGIVAAFAGGNGMPVPTEQESVEHWREVLDDDLTSTFLTVQVFLPQMLEASHGSIITMSSAAARQAARSTAVPSRHWRR
jgi:3-oxoacyl-[acyl-carrier protein] reductase